MRREKESLRSTASPPVESAPVPVMMLVDPAYSPAPPSASKRQQLRKNELFEFPLLVSACELDEVYSNISDDNCPTPPYVPQQLRCGLDDSAAILIDGGSPAPSQDSDDLRRNATKAGSVNEEDAVKPTKTRQQKQPSRRQPHRVGRKVASARKNKESASAKGKRASKVAARPATRLNTVIDLGSSLYEHVASRHKDFVVHW